MSDQFDPEPWLRSLAEACFRAAAIGRESSVENDASRTMAERFTAAADELARLRQERDELRGRVARITDERDNALGLLRCIGDLLGKTEHRQHPDDETLSVISAEHLRWIDEAYEIACGDHTLEQAQALARRARERT